MSGKIKMFGLSGWSVEEVFGDFVLAQTANGSFLEYRNWVIINFLRSSFPVAYHVLSRGLPAPGALQCGFVRRWPPDTALTAADGRQCSVSHSSP